jgi:hypothetical protein
MVHEPEARLTGRATIQNPTHCANLQTGGSVALAHT